LATPRDACQPHFGGGVSLIATLVTLKREDLVNPDPVPMPA
jgi:hypothetical protein